MTMVLKKLTELGYTVDWMLLNLSWLRQPQTRPRLFLIASQPDVLAVPTLPNQQDLLTDFNESRYNAFSPVLTAHSLGWKARSFGSLTEIEKDLRPEVGKAQSKSPCKYGYLGRAIGDSFCSFDLSRPSESLPSNKLSSIVAPNFRNGEKIRSARHWTTDSGRGPTKLHIRDKPISHCIGSSIGWAPLFCLPLYTVKNSAARK